MKRGWEKLNVHNVTKGISIEYLGLPRQAAKRDQRPHVPDMGAGKLHQNGLTGARDGQSFPLKKKGISQW
jgi:hypothetical protein